MGRRGVSGDMKQADSEVLEEISHLAVPSSLDLIAQRLLKGPSTTAPSDIASILQWPVAENWFV